MSQRTKAAGEPCGSLEGVKPLCGAKPPRRASAQVAKAELGDAGRDEASAGKLVETRRGVVIFRENPFLRLGISSSEKRVIKNGNMMLVNKSTGELVSDVAGFWETETVDSTKFLKLFVNGVKALSGLTNAGTKVFELLYIEMQNNMNKDKVYLSFAALSNEQLSMISRATFRRGIAELIDKKFLAAGSAPAWYWVNPTYLWNGDRLAFVKEYRRERHGVAIENNNVDQFSLI